MVGKFGGDWKDRSQESEGACFFIICHLLLFYVTSRSYFINSYLLTESGFV